MRKILVLLQISVLALVGVGIVVLASASTVRADSLHPGDPHYFLKRQLVWMVLALALGILAARFDYHLWQKHAWLRHALLAITILGLIAVFIPHVGICSHGSSRWIGYETLRFQPSEMAKMATVILLACWMSSLGWRVRTFWKGFLLPALVLCVGMVLLMLEPDFGATFVTAVVGGAILFVAGARLVFVITTAGAIAIGFVGMILHDKVRSERLLVYLVDLCGKTSAMTEWLAQALGMTVDQVLLDVANSNKKHQAEQARLAFINGGLLGVGLNNSMQKRYYLPEAHTDFIYAIVGEELGLPFSLLVLLLFGVILVCGFLIASRAPDRLGRLMAFGVTLLLVFQAFFNIGVATDCLPTKGLALPFISYGGSSLLTAFVAIGVLVNIGAHIVQPDDHVRADLFNGELQEV